MKDLKVTHDDRLSKLRVIFGVRQEIARNTGKKHDVSISKICSDAKVDKIYLFGHRLKEGNPIRAKYLALKEEILQFQKDLVAGTEKTEERKKAEHFEAMFNCLLADIEPLQRELAFLKSNAGSDQDKLETNRQRITELLARIADLESKLANCSKSSKVPGNLSPVPQKHLVSPHLFQVNLGINTPESRTAEQIAWGKAYKKLEQLLSRNLKMRLYILVGLPCSGKTTWAEEVALSNDRHPVIWEAANLTSMERYKFIVSLSRFTDLPVTCVYFETDMEIIRERNRTLRSAEMQINEDDLFTMNNILERPDPYQEKWIDALIIVRQQYGR